MSTLLLRVIVSYHPFVRQRVFVSPTYTFFIYSSVTGDYFVPVGAHSVVWNE